MDMTLQKFMGLAITAAIVLALVFGVAANSIKSKTNTGSTSYKTTIESPEVPDQTSLKQ